MIEHELHDVYHMLRTVCLRVVLVSVRGNVPVEELIVTGEHISDAGKSSIEKFCRDTKAPRCTVSRWSLLSSRLHGQMTTLEKAF